MGMRTVHVTLPAGVSEAELVEFFQKRVGPLREWNFCYRKRTFLGKNLGYGLLQFQSEEDAERACELSAENCLILRSSSLAVNPARWEIKQLPSHGLLRWEKGIFSGGCLVSPCKFKRMWSPQAEVVTEFDFQPKLVRILFQQGLHWEYKLEFPFKDNLQVKDVHEDVHRKALLFKPRFAPLLHKRRISQPVSSIQDPLLDKLVGILGTPDRDSCHVEEDGEPWVRSVDFSPGRPICQCHAYLLQVEQVTDEMNKDVLKKLADYGITTLNVKRLKVEVEEEGSYASSHELIAPLIASPHQHGLSFEIVFKLNSLVQFGKVPGASLSAEFFDLIRPSYEAPVDWTMQALHRMQVSEEVVYDPVHFLLEVRKRMSKGDPHLDYRIQPAEGQMLIRRMMVTPTKVYFLGPELECSNRVTREFVMYSENFLRVSFVEEDFDELQAFALAKPMRSLVHGQMRPDSTAVHQRMKDIMTKGFWIWDRKFEFLAFSASQLREKSLWMFASPNAQVTCDKIRAFMGNFDNIRNVAKCAARMGQCFSSSTPTLHVPLEEVRHIADIETHCNGIKYIFSDGIGTMSVEFARDVAHKCGYTGRVPTAFQIRYGGYKGVVAQNPASKHKLCLRPSMCKFESTHTGFEVLSHTRPQPCFLNRQIIILLSTLGIADYVFLQMQNDMLKMLDEMLEDSQLAIQLWELCHAGEAHGVMTALLKAGYNPKMDPHLRGLMYAFRAEKLVSLRLKSRILVPKGRLLMGCLDETKTLEDGQVFVQVSPSLARRSFLMDGLNLFPVYKNGDVSTYVITGDVVVAKNPCLHPGDIRILCAVNNPRLQEYMVDCLVFPQVGKRPHPSECSGSDLDGDMYFVTWDQLLVPMKMDEPLSYEAPPDRKLDHAPTLNEIIEFHADSAMSQTLGPICNAHVVHADKSPRKARDPKCLELANLSSIAVDFPKTGVPAILPTNLKPSEYPDFMEKEHTKKAYVSLSILGKLFRGVKESSEHDVPPGPPTKADLALAFDQTLVVDGYQEYLQIAEIHKSWYDYKLIGLMNQYGIQRETEICTGYIVWLAPIRKRIGAEKDRIALSMKALQKEATTNFYQDLSPEKNEKEVMAKASAYYYVTYSPQYFGKNFSSQGSNVHLLSFAWQFFEQLLCVKASRGACKL